jgi:hypothetical protein
LGWSEIRQPRAPTGAQYPYIGWRQQGWDLGLEFNRLGLELNRPTLLSRSRRIFAGGKPALRMCLSAPGGSKPPPVTHGGWRAWRPQGPTAGPRTYVYSKSREVRRAFNVSISKRPGWNLGFRACRCTAYTSRPDCSVPSIVHCIYQ